MTPVSFPRPLALAVILLILGGSSPSSGAHRAAIWRDAAGNARVGPALAGTWHDFRRGLFMVFERTPAGYTIHPFQFVEGPGRRLRNVFEGLALPVRQIRGVLGFRGEGTPPSDPEGRTWRIEGSLRKTDDLDRLQGEIRVEWKPYPTPPLDSRPITLHHFPQAPTLSVFRSGMHRGTRPTPTARRARELPVTVDVQMIRSPGGIEQSEADHPAPLPRPSREHLFHRRGETLVLDPDSVW